MTPEDPYSRLEYRRSIAWPKRIAREAPFLDAVLGDATPRRLLDLGCGTGEHARFLADRGFEVVGVDRSQSMIATARTGPPVAKLALVEGDLASLDHLVTGPFGGAICLGNTLPHLTEPGAVDRFLRGLRTHLEPGAPIVFQLLNYDQILATGARHLPLNIRHRGEDDGEVDDIVFLRLMTPRDDGSVIFNPTSLRYRPGADPPVEVVATKNVHLRGWRWDEVRPLLRAAGFREMKVYGGMRRETWDPEQSQDLVVVAR